MADQHRVVATCVARTRGLLRWWRDDPSDASSSELVATLDLLSDALAEHLDEEEEYVLPLVRRHLTVSEWEELGQRSLEKFPRGALPVLLGQLLDVTSPLERAQFFGKLPIPVRLTWRLAGRRRYARYIRRVRGTGPEPRAATTSARQHHNRDREGMTL